MSLVKCCFPTQGRYPMYISDQQGDVLCFAVVKYFFLPGFRFHSTCVCLTVKAKAKNNTKYNV